MGETGDEESDDPRENVEGENHEKQLAVGCDAALGATEYEELSAECEDSRERNEECGDIDRRRCGKDDVGE